MDVFNTEIKEIIAKELVRNAKLSISQEAREATAQALNRIIAEIERREEEVGEAMYAEWVQSADEATLKEFGIEK